MAVFATVETAFGERRELYIRLNNIESSNHGQKTNALFRGFVSKDAFENCKHYIYEVSCEFDADIKEPLWPQAYKALSEQEGILLQEA